jgi:hypothetical protein
MTNKGRIPAGTVTGFAKWLLVARRELVKELPMAELHWRDSYDEGLRITLEPDAS